MNTESYPLPDVAEAMGVKFTRVRQLVADHVLLQVRNDRGVRAVPAECLITDGGDTQPVPHIAGAMTTLLDGGFSEEEATQWMLSPHPVLGEAPILLLRRGVFKPVNRQAQAEAF